MRRASPTVDYASAYMSSRVILRHLELTFPPGNLILYSDPPFCSTLATTSTIFNPCFRPSSFFDVRSGLLSAPSNLIPNQYSSSFLRPSSRKKRAQQRTPRQHTESLSFLYFKSRLSKRVNVYKIRPPIPMVQLNLSKIPTTLICKQFSTPGFNLSFIHLTFRDCLTPSLL